MQSKAHDVFLTEDVVTTLRNSEPNNRAVAQAAMGPSTSTPITTALESDNQGPAAMRGQFGPPRAESLGRAVDVAAQSKLNVLSLRESGDSNSRDRYFDLADRIMEEPLVPGFSTDVYSEHNRYIHGGPLPYSNIHSLATTPYYVNGGFGPDDEDIFGACSPTDDPSSGQTIPTNFEPGPAFMVNLRRRSLPVNAPPGRTSQTPRGHYARTGQREYSIPDGLKSYEIVDRYMADIVADVLLELFKHGWTVDAICTWANRSVDSSKEHEIITNANLRKRLSLARRQKQAGTTGTTPVPLINWTAEELEYANGQ